MKVRLAEEGEPSLVFDDIEPFSVEMLRQLPADSDPGDNEAARERLYSHPMGPAEDGNEFNEDWQNFVQPEIRDLFRSAREMVVEDLVALSNAKATPLRREHGMILFDPADFVPGEGAMTVPMRHFEAWMSVLNQARLVIAARRNFGEAAMDEEWPFPPFSERDLDLYKVHFYDEIQQVFLQVLGY